MEESVVGGKRMNISLEPSWGPSGRPLDRFFHPQTQKRLIACHARALPTRLSQSSKPSVIKILKSLIFTPPASSPKPSTSIPNPASDHPAPSLKPPF